MIGQPNHRLLGIGRDVQIIRTHLKSNAQSKAHKAKVRPTRQVDTDEPQDVAYKAYSLKHEQTKKPKGVCWLSS